MRRLVPNQSARELRREFLDSAPEQRLRQAIELSHVGAVLARAGGFATGVDPTVRFDDVLRELSEADVGFVLVGDLAVAVHGYVRATLLVEVIPRPETDNLDVAGRWRGTLRIADGDLPYDVLRAEAERVDLSEIGHPIWVASVDHLIGMRQRAGRDQDLIDVTALRMAHGLEG